MVNDLRCLVNFYRKLIARLRYRLKKSRNTYLTVLDLITVTRMGFGSSMTSFQQIIYFGELEMLDLIELIYADFSMESQEYLTMVILTVTLR